MKRFIVEYITCFCSEDRELISTVEIHADSVDEAREQFYTAYGDYYIKRIVEVKFK